MPASIIHDGSDPKSQEREAAMQKFIEETARQARQNGAQFLQEVATPGVMQFVPNPDQK